MAKFILDEYLVRVYGNRWNRVDQKLESDKIIRMLYWGDTIDSTNTNQNNDSSSDRVDISIYNYGTGKYESAYIKKKKKRKRKKTDPQEYIPLKFREDDILQVLYVDVQQGDATIVTLPNGEKLLIDGGEGKFIARNTCSPISENHKR